jgi:Ca-activated chloride channel family protein
MDGTSASARRVEPAETAVVLHEGALMRWGLLAVGAAVLLAASLVSARQEPVFRSRTESVPVYVTVIGDTGHFVTDLTREDFQIFDNGRPQPITVFASGLQPISIIVMLDMSGSMLGNIDVLRRAAVQMFTRLLPGDKARVGNFGDRIVISPTFTNDVDTLIRALYLDLEPGGPTPLWGAVNAAMAALAHLDGRRVVLVLSDGKNTGLRTVNGLPSGPTLREVITRAQTEDFMVYAIGMRSRMVPAAQGSGGYQGGFGGYGRRRGLGGFGGFGGDEPDPGLRELADESGGGYFALDGAENLADTFARVADELHRQYLLGYVPPENDGRIHQIQVRTKDPSLKVRARRSYEAPQRR